MIALLVINYCQYKLLYYFKFIVGVGYKFNRTVTAYKIIEFRKG